MTAPIVDPTLRHQPKGVSDQVALGSVNHGFAAGLAGLRPSAGTVSEYPRHTPTLERAA